MLYHALDPLRGRVALAEIERETILCACGCHARSVRSLSWTAKGLD